MSVARRADGRWLVKFKQHGKWVQKTFRDEATAASFDESMNAPTVDSRPSVMELAVSAHTLNITPPRAQKSNTSLMATRMPHLYGLTV